MPRTTPSIRKRMRGASSSPKRSASRQAMARAHGEDVAQDAADAGGRPLVGLDEARVVVALHLEDGHEAVADVDHAGVLARALQHVRSAGRELLEIDLRRLVGAVLGP